MHQHAGEPHRFGGEGASLTPAALRALQARADRLALSLDSVRAAARLRDLENNHVAPTTFPDADLQLALVRLASMRNALEHAEIVGLAGAVVVGRRVLVKHDEDGAERDTPVAPGQANAGTARVFAGADPGGPS